MSGLLPSPLHPRAPCVQHVHLRPSPALLSSTQHSAPCLPVSQPGLVYQPLTQACLPTHVGLGSLPGALWLLQLLAGTTANISAPLHPRVLYAGSSQWLNQPEHGGAPACSHGGTKCACVHAPGPCRWSTRGHRFGSCGGLWGRRVWEGVRCSSCEEARHWQPWSEAALEELATSPGVLPALRSE